MYHLGYVKLAKESTVTEAFLCVCVHVCVCMYIHMWCVCMSMCIHVCVYTHMVRLCTCMCVYTCGMCACVCALHQSLGGME